MLKRSSGHPRPNRSLRRWRPYPPFLRWQVHGVDRSGWCIRGGISQFLVAYGSGWSAPVGRELFRSLAAPRTIYGKQLPRRRPC
ncbi:hypothetical protein Ga0061061_11187 [Chelatococcus sambhunathii]|uniref:Uncharacterized protein n=1 Tax=Chelatococcus sambhunathii TaxID=363953 RepID=A0ABM9UE94_9HYPH|nr:hypothetical protein Ga0061061_11187 [Chelatococcus sambhunathii]